MAKRVISQDEKYSLAAAEFSDAIGRLAYAYERDADKRKDLVQNIHFELWRSFKIFDAVQVLGHGSTVLLIMLALATL